MVERGSQFYLENIIKNNLENHYFFSFFLNGGQAVYPLWLRGNIEHQEWPVESSVEQYYVKCHLISFIESVRVLCRDREERMAALSAAQQEAMEELQKKIQMKATYFPFLSMSAVCFLFGSPGSDRLCLFTPTAYSMTRAAADTWSRSSRGKRRRPSWAAADTPTPTMLPNSLRTSARSSAPFAVLWWENVFSSTFLTLFVLSLLYHSAKLSF